MSGPVWKAVSDEGKDFISRLLVVDTTQRYNAFQAQKHPWLQLEPSLEATAETRDAVYKGLSGYSKEGEFKKLAMQVVARKATTEEIFKLRKVFQDMDADGDGQITRNEFKIALTKSGTYSTAQIDAMFKDMDMNESGSIEYTEFLAATLECRGRIEDQRIAEAFDQFDTDGSGYISKEELHEILGKDVKEAYMDKLMKEVDTDKDGRISYLEFNQAFSGMQDSDMKKMKATGKQDSASSLGFMRGLSAKLAL